MGMICIRFHSSEKLNFKRQLGLDIEPEEAIQKYTKGKISFDCYEYPQDDEYTYLVYMRTENPQFDAKAVFSFLQGCLNPESNLLIEVAICNHRLEWERVVYSNTTDYLYYGYGWAFFSNRIGGYPLIE